MADSPRSILARLEQLKQWQEQQQRVLLEKHIAQQQLLEREQQKMYEVLGLQNATEGESYQESYESSDSEPEYEETNMQAQVASEMFKLTSVNHESATFDSDQEYPSAEPEDALKKQSNIPKRPFLKRGEGLRARFKVDPDKFKLNNLPTYKFAHHNRERNNRKNRSRHGSGPAIDGKHTANSSQPASKESRTTSKEKDNGLQPIVEKKPRHKSDVGIVLDVNRVQDKRLKSTRRQGGSLPPIVNNDFNIQMEANEDNNLIDFAKQSSLEHGKEIHNLGAPSDAPWKRRLDPSAVPVVSKEQRDLNFFELLEQKVVGKNFNPDSSSILRFISANDTTANDETLANDDTVSNQAEGEPLIRPDDYQTMGGLAPLPSDVPIDDATDDSEESGEEDKHVHVRFVDDGKSVSGNTSDVTDNESYMLKGVTLSKMSTPNDKFGHRSLSLEQAARDNDVSDSDDTSECGDEDCTTADNPHDQSEGEETVTKVGDGDDTLRNEILAKSELLKERLAELEREIDSYRRENAELIRAKQEHEIERQNLQQDREEMEERMNDERIKMEVYFHDERMKIEAERKQALKEAQKPNKKDREEILRLNEELSEAKKQQKERDLKHSASLARFRAQVKNMEKDLQETRLELEVAKKDNRRLETENARLKRQNNSRMLVEINRNIAKLATGGGAEAEEQGRKKNSMSPEKAKVGPKMEGKVKSYPVHVTERKVSQVRAKVTSHLPPARTAGQRQSQAKRLPARGNDSSMDSDENDENIPKSKHLPVAEEVNVLSDSDDDDDVTEEELSESSSSVAEPQPSSYFAKKSVRKTLFDVVNVDKDPAQPKQGLVRRESPPRHDRTPEASEIVKNLKREIVNADGSRDIWYPNGNLKKISPDGMTIRMLYFNKDIKETNMAEGTTKYYYSETNTWHTTYLDGLEILEFPDGQTEHRFKDGSTEVHFPNGSIRTTNPNSADIAEEWKYPDGTTVIIRKNEDKEISLPNGQVEIHTKAHKRRIYPDGTVKFVYPDGSQESRYSNGRIRLKDKDGRLISDTGGAMVNSALR
ncbi:centromere protein J [Anopheles ziemanni]|uniref:centromere protein J n=1 Tax=Anopheles coustani TaxID=139045 RepID=UPI00265819F9|nr:centromere protein J [Anopheles coustani]XP_058174263.1 centromere protein J [Anopheles ziemanni]